MPFERPSIPTIIERVTADLESRGFGADTRVRRSVLYVLARVIAGVAHGLYGFIAWASRQFLADTADEDNLIRIAGLYGIISTPATSAVGNVTFTGAGRVVIPVGLRLQRADGFEYLVTTEGIIAFGTITLPVQAVSPGVAGNADEDVQLAIAAQVSGLSAVGIVASGAIAGGADPERVGSLRDRVLTFLRKRPQGGAAHDYVAWAKEVPGVTRAWAKPHLNGLGTMGLFFVRDGDENPIPGPSAVAAVQIYIDGLRPVTVKDFTAYAPVAQPVNFVIALEPDSTAGRAAVTAQLQDLFRRESEPGVTIPLTHFAEAISLAAGEYDHDLTTPSVDVTAGAGYMPTMGTVTWA